MSRELTRRDATSRDRAQDALANLQARMLRAAVERRDLSDLELQHDTVEGARRVVAMLRAAQRNATTQQERDLLVQRWVEARDYCAQAEAVLARLEAHGAIEAARQRRLGAGH
jgi:hypothetical protein